MATEPPLPDSPPPIPVASLEPARRVSIEPHHHHHHRRRRHGYETHFRTGRLWLIGIFCLLRLADGILYLNAYIYQIPLNYVHSSAIGFGLWTTALLVAMWMRQGWARYCLIGLLSVHTTLLFWVLENVYVGAGSERFDYIPALIIFIQLGVIYLLVGIKAIRRLTNRSYA
jgi:hypothetical protein